MPAIPLYVFYALFSIDNARYIFLGSLRNFIFILLTVSICITYFGQYTKTDFGPLKSDVFAESSQQLFHYIRENTNEDETFIIYRPRTLSLHTGRKAAVFLKAEADKDLYQYMRKIKANYIIIGNIFNQQQFLRSFIKRNADHFKRVYTNVDFEVYKISDGFTQPDIFWNEKSLLPIYYIWLNN